MATGNRKEYAMYTDQAYGKLAKFTHKDLITAVVVRGYGFNDAISKSHGEIADFFLRHYEEEEKPELLAEYDKWLEAEIVKNPDYEPTLLHPTLRLGYIPESEIEKQAERIKVIAQPKPIKEKTEEGLVKGTKKALTYALTKEGLDLEEIVERVCKVFEDAKENSIAIWYRRALKEINE